ncbi:calcineurin is a calcium-dependent [Seiridium cupressi]
MTVPPIHQNASPGVPSGKENVPPHQLIAKATQHNTKSTGTPVPAPQLPPADVTLHKPVSAGRKRKSDAVAEPETLPEIDDDDPRLEVVDQDCHQVRTKIRRFLDSGAMKVGEFQTAIDVGSVGYYRFINQRGREAGAGSDVYYKAWRFFKKRELQGLKSTGAKKAKPSSKASSTASQALDVTGITLDGEDKGEVAVFDTCDEIRKKIRAFLRKEDVTQAAFLREIAKSFHVERKVQSKQLNDFLSKSGPTDGNTSCVYYGSYVFFEKLRIKQDKPKSAMRLEMEKLYGKSGVNTTEQRSRWVFLTDGEHPYEDEYGRTHIVSAKGRDTVF